MASDTPLLDELFAGADYVPVSIECPEQLSSAMRQVISELRTRRYLGETKHPNSQYRMTIAMLPHVPKNELWFINYDGSKAVRKFDDVNLSDGTGE